MGLIALLGITISTSTVVFGTRLIPAAMASLIITSNPVITALMSRVILNESLSGRKLAGIVIAFTGFLIVLVYGGPQAKFDVQNLKGALITFLSPLTWSLYTILSKPFLRRVPPAQFAGLVTIIGTIPALPLLLVNPGVFSAVTSFDRIQALALFMTAVMALVVGYAIWYRGLRILTPTQLTVYSYLTPVFGVLGAWFFLGEKITIFLLLGALTILSGVVLTNTARRSPVDEPERPVHAQTTNPASPAETAPDPGPRGAPGDAALSSRGLSE
jgi:drug/metabolite transporter (DMT)-like permease